MHGPVRDETRSGGLHFNDVVQPITVDQLPLSGVGESGCTSRHILILFQPHTACGGVRGVVNQVLTMTFLLDGHQALKYGFDEYSYLRGSVDVPLA